MSGRKESFSNSNMTAATPSAPPPTEHQVEDDDLLTKFLDFLNCPIWVMPVMSFLEQKSLGEYLCRSTFALFSNCSFAIKAFDSDKTDDRLYRSIHTEYRHLVDTLIQSFCEDVSSTVSQLVDVLRKRQVS